MSAVAGMATPLKAADGPGARTDGAAVGAGFNAALKVSGRIELAADAAALFAAP